MGCGLSQTYRPINIRINILDQDFLKKQNDKFRDKMQKLKVKFKTYTSLNKMIDNLQEQYCNIIIATDEMEKELTEQLLKVNLFPNLFVKSIKKQQPQNFQKVRSLKIKYFRSYEQLISQFLNSTQNNQCTQKNLKKSRSDSFVNLKILLQSSMKTESQIQIIKKTLTLKDILFQFYHTFLDFQQSLKIKGSKFVVCDYLYHREVLNLISDPYQTRIICLCKFSQKETYDQRVYFLTDKWTEIVNEIKIQQKWSHLNLVKCSKVFLYQKNQNSIAQYAQTIQKFGFDVKIYFDLSKIMAESKHYFALSIVISPQNKQQVDLFLQNNEYKFKTKLVSIQKNTQNSIQSLRQVIKQLKRGYYGKKSVTRSIDIIDKHFDNIKYLSIREQLSKCNILCHMYPNIDEFISSLKYISPYVVVNEEQSELLLSYLKQIKSNSKVILLSHRHSLTSPIKNQHNFFYVTDHFGKIITFVKNHPVYNPVIPETMENSEQSMLKQQHKKYEEDFDKIDPSEIQDENTDLESHSMSRYTTKYKKSVR